MNFLDILVVGLGATTITGRHRRHHSGETGRRLSPRRWPRSAASAHARQVVLPEHARDELAAATDADLGEQGLRWFCTVLTEMRGWAAIALDGRPEITRCGTCRSRLVSP
jgi:hypothetical protein